MTEFTPGQLKRITPTLDLWLWRPILHEPPMYTMRDLREWVTLDDVMDAHEALNYKGAVSEKVNSQNGGR